MTTKVEIAMMKMQEELLYSTYTRASQAYTRFSGKEIMEKNTQSFQC
jgi:hypothetical protein